MQDKRIAAAAVVSSLRVVVALELLPVLWQQLTSVGLGCRGRPWCGLGCSIGACYCCTDGRSGFSHL